MKYLIKTWFGLFIINDSMEIIEKSLYPKDVDKLIEKNLRQEKEVMELKDQMENLKDPSEEIEKKFKKTYWGMHSENYKDIMNEFFFEYTNQKIQEGFREKGEIIIRSINLLNDLNKSIGVLEESIKDFSTFISNESDLKDLNQLYLDKDYLNEREKSDRELIESFEKLISSRERLKELIKNEMRDFAPNISEISGEVLGAKLISLAGGLDKLAKKPSGTIQVLGAEKALFRHLRNGSDPPKHGVIFEHPFVRNTHWKKRGKVARTLASKIAIASRIDYFTKKEKSESLKKELKKRVKEVRQN